MLFYLVMAKLVTHGDRPSPGFSLLQREKAAKLGTVALNRVTLL